MGLFASWMPFIRAHAQKKLRCLQHINIFYQTGTADSTWRLFRHFHVSVVVPDKHTFNMLFRGCRMLDEGKQIHAVIIKSCCDSETICKTSLLSMYFKFGCVGDTFRVFEEIGVKDVVCWNAMLAGLCQNRHEKECVLLFQQMQENGVLPNGFSCSSVLKASSCLSAVELGRQLHGYITVSGFYNSDVVVLATALVDLYSKCGLIHEAWKVFSELDKPADTILCNSLIFGFVHNGKYLEAMNIFRNLAMRSMKQNQHTMATLLSACSGLSCLLTGKEIHAVIIKGGFKSDTVLHNALLDMYAKVGKIRNAQRVFDSMLERNVITWTSLIDAYGIHGDGSGAVALFEKMVHCGVPPNAVTLLSVINACSHSGLVADGCRYFWFMKEKYGVDHGPEHYACFIDLLGRAGRLEEAWDLVNSMESEPTTAVYASLLNACKTNQDVLGVETSAKILFKLKQEKPALYLMLSNLYAVVGRWEDAENVRSVMKKRGLTKEVGSSLISVGM